MTPDTCVRSCARAQEWVTFTIDDRIPVDAHRNMLNIQISRSGELWPCLLEKAFAALWGSYEHLDGGTPLLALTALTGVTKLDKNRILKLRRSPEVPGKWQCWRPLYADGSRGPRPSKLTVAPWPDDGANGHRATRTDDQVTLAVT